MTRRALLEPLGGDNGSPPSRGFVCVGQLADTPELAGDSIAQWWASEGQAVCPQADRALILAVPGPAPLRSFQTLLECIRRATTETGLMAEVFLVNRAYAKGQQVKYAEMRALNLAHDALRPNWSYTIDPLSA